MTWRRSSGRVLVPTYVESGALDRLCPHCGAAPAQWCRTPDGRDRRIPCLDRTGTGDGP